jgi:hypothetical protein
MDRGSGICTPQSNSTIDRNVTADVFSDGEPTARVGCPGIFRARLAGRSAIRVRKIASFAMRGGRGEGAVDGEKNGEIS